MTTSALGYAVRASWLRAIALLVISRWADCGEWQSFAHLDLALPARDTSHRGMLPFGCSL